MSLNELAAASDTRSTRRRRRNARGRRVLTAAAFAGIVAATTTLPKTQAAFSDQTINAGNTIEAAASFGPSGLVHSWPFEGNADDVVGSVHGSIVGATTIVGRYGSGLSFDGINDGVAFPNFSYDTDFSLAFDFRIGSNPGTFFQYIYSHGNINTTDSVNVFLSEAGHGTDPNLLRTVARDIDDTLDNFALEFDISGLIGDGMWHNYTLTVDSVAGLTVYLDGVLVASDPTRGTDGFAPVGFLHAGARHDLDADRFYSGDLDTLQIYDHALTPAEALDLAS